MLRLGTKQDALHWLMTALELKLEISQMAYFSHLS
jgi:hypothetical protein